MKKVYFKKRILYFFAAIVWMIAGFNILHIGIKAWGAANAPWNYLWLVASLYFFSFMVFPKVVQRNIKAIRSDKRRKLPLWACMVPRAWVIMIVMMTFGILLRHSGLVSATFISGFYIGIGISLIVAVWPYWHHGLFKSKA